MPPKKMSEKAIVAELKKKNAVLAKEIVASLKRESDGGPTAGAANIVKKPSRKKTEKGSAAEPKKKNVVQAKEIASKVKRVTESSTKSVQNIVRTANEVVIEAASDSTENGGSSIADHFEITEQVELLPKSSTPQGTKSLEASGSKASKPKFPVWAAKGKKVRKPRGDYRYEIDCTRVADSIDVIHVQRHLEKHLNVHGEDNLNGTISIHCEGQKVVITSKDWFPKKSLRFLSKKFLKKYWNIQVVYKDKRSYEYKYVGTL